jgi:hypothetical protein
MRTNPLATGAVSKDDDDDLWVDRLATQLATAVQSLDWFDGCDQPRSHTGADELRR